MSIMTVAYCTKKIQNNKSEIVLKKVKRISKSLNQKLNIKMKNRLQNPQITGRNSVVPPPYLNDDCP